MGTAIDLGLAVAALVYLDFALYRCIESPFVGVLLIVAAGVRIAGGRRRLC